MKRLQKVQNDLMRIITKSKLIKNEPIKELLGKLDFLSVNQLAAKQILNTTWSFMNYNVEPMDSILKGKERKESLRSVTTGLINPATRNRFSFPFQAKMLWNHKKSG